MAYEIREIAEADIKAVLEVARQAWAPVFVSLAQVLGPEIWHRMDEDPVGSQLRTIEELCRADDGGSRVWLAESSGASGGSVKVLGFVAYKLDFDEKRGEIWFLAVHPDYQNGGLGTELNLFALERMREAGMTLAVVETGGDPSHAPARRAYEKAGFTGLPIVRYFQTLESE